MSTLDEMRDALVDRLMRWAEDGYVPPAAWVRSDLDAFADRAQADARAGLVEAIREDHRPVAYHWSVSGESGTVCAASLAGLHSRVTHWPCSVESAIVAAQDRLAARARRTPEVEG